MRVFLLICLIMGSFLGAGFASGKEIITYFSVFGGASYLGIIFCAITFVFLLLFFFWLSHKVNGLDGLIATYFSGHGKAIKWLFMLSILILVSTMFAGAGSIGEALGINKWIAIFLTAIVVFVSNYFGLKSIGGLNAIIVPIMLVILLVVSFGSYTRTSFDFGILPIFSGVTYSFINMLMIGLFILEIGAKYTKKEYKSTSVLCGGIICTLLLICNGGLMSVSDLNLDMPMLYLAKNNCKIIYVLAIATIWLAILTTLFSNVYVLDSYFRGLISKKSYRLFFILLLSIIVSMFGFGIMVKYMYLFIGLVGAILVGRVVIKERISR